MPLLIAQFAGSLEVGNKYIVLEYSVDVDLAVFRNKGDSITMPLLGWKDKETFLAMLFQSLVEKIGWRVWWKALALLLSCFAVSGCGQKFWTEVDQGRRRDELDVYKEWGRRSECGKEPRIMS